MWPLSHFGVCDRNCRISKEGLDVQLGVRALSEDCSDIVGLMAVTCPTENYFFVLNEVYKENPHLIKRSRALLKGLCWPDYFFADQDGKFKVTTPLREW